MWERRLYHFSRAHPSLTRTIAMTSIAAVIGLPPFSLGWYIANKKQADKQQKLLDQLQDCHASEQWEKCKQISRKPTKVKN